DFAQRGIELAVGREAEFYRVYLHRPKQVLLGDELTVDALARHIVARVPVVARTAIAGQVRPGEEDVRNAFCSQGGQSLFAGSALEDAGELAVVEAGVIDRRQLQIE